MICVCDNCRKVGVMEFGLNEAFGVNFLDPLVHI